MSAPLAIARTVLGLTLFGPLPRHRVSGASGRRILLLVRVFCKAFALLLVWPFLGMAEDFKVRSWYVADGLPDNTVTALAQTPDGYLWIGTPKGLARFDGNRFTRLESSGGTALKDPRVVGLLADRQGGLWIASASGLVTQFAQGRFCVRYPLDEALSEESPAAPAWEHVKSVLGLDSSGAVLVSTSAGAVMRFRDGSRPEELSTEELPPGRVRELETDGAGRVWILKGTNSCLLDNNRWVFRPEEGSPGLAGLLCSGGENGVWTLEVTNREAFVKLVGYDQGKGWSNVRLSIPTTPAMVPVSAMLQDSEGRVWLGTTWGGVHLQGRGGEWVRVQARGPLARGTARCLLEDSQGTIWVGMIGQGLQQVLEPSVKMVLLPPEAGDFHVTTVWAAKDGGLWIGSNTGLYHRAASDSARVSAMDGLKGESIHAVLEDTRGKLWVATRSGLFVKEGSTFRKVVALPRSHRGLVSLYEDRAGGIWVGGYQGSLLRLPPGADNAGFERQVANPTLTLCGFTEDERGRIYVVSKRRGIPLWRLDGNELVAVSPELSKLNVLARSVLCDTEGTIWVGTQGDGLYRWSNKVLQHYTMADGFGSDVIMGLLADEQGRLWMTSQTGIIGCSRRELAEYVPGRSPPLLCTHLGLDEGMANRECTGAGQPVISRGEEGRFWVATMLGVAGFAPEVLKRFSASTEVKVEALRADGQVLQPGPQGYRVPASARRYEFEYTAPEFRSPQSLRFRYRLDGMDENWVEAKDGRLATYNRLPAGEYHFRVMAGGEDGFWREAKKPLILHVVPRYWQTGWFRILTGAGAVLALVGGVAWRERRKVRLRLERLEAQRAIEQVRRRIAQDLHDDLGSAITEIVQLGDLTLQPGAGPEELRPSLETMTGLARRLGIAMDEIVWTMSSRNDTLPNLAGYITNYAQEFLRHAGITCRLDVTRNLPEVEVNSQTRHDLFLAIKEALNNAAKHSGPSEVVVRVHYRDHVVQVNVEDNGRGFDLPAAEEGEGLKNMRERLRAIGGEIAALVRSATERS